MMNTRRLSPATAAVALIALLLASVTLVDRAMVGTHAQEENELVFGTEIFDPSMQFTFLAAPTGNTTPVAEDPTVSQSDFHMEVLAVWADNVSSDLGAPPGGFIPYLHMFATLTNAETGETQRATLIPHINFSDSFHYAQNMKLPGGPDELYDAMIEVYPPGMFDLSFHEDARQTLGDQLFEPRNATYTGLNLSEIVAATRG